MKVFRVSYLFLGEVRTVLVTAEFYEHRLGGVEFFVPDLLDGHAVFVAAVPNVDTVAEVAVASRPVKAEELAKEEAL